MPHPPLTHPDKRMRSIEGARALAALVVVLMHATTLMRVEHFSGHIGLGNVFKFGYIGVDFFFVLSGFIITYVHFNQLGRGVSGIGDYLWRRFSRIFPIYWSVLGLSVGLTALVRWQAGTGPLLDMTSQDIPSTLALWIGGGEPKYLGVAWSLQYELLFYSLFCLLLWNLRLGLSLFAAWALLIVLGATPWLPMKLPAGLGSSYCLEFLLGVCVGLTARNYILRVMPWGLVGAVLALVAAAMFEIWGPWGPFGMHGRVALGLASAALLLSLVALERAGRIRTPAWLAFLGSVSYSIYLGHCLFINMTYSVLLKLGLYHRLPEVVVFALAIGVAVSATSLIGRYIELPLVRLLKNRHAPSPPRLVAGNSGL